MEQARERRQKCRERDHEESDRLLTPRTGANYWSNSTGYYGKSNIPLLVAGTDSHRRRDDSDQARMKRHIECSKLDQAMVPREDGFKLKFNPVGIPLLDILAVDAENKYGWSYPSRKTLSTLQDNRGLSMSMLERCKVREIILNGNQSELDQREMVDWCYEQLLADHKEMPGSPISLDVEQVTCTLGDVLRLGDQLPHVRREVELSSRPTDEYFHGQRDRFVQMPCRTMLGNGVSWALMITILTKPVKKGKKVSHSIEKFKIPSYVLDLLESLPMCVGFGIKGDVLAIEDTFGLLAGRPVKLLGFVELGSLLLFAGWGERTVNMPSCHAIVCGSVLNKTVSCGDGLWGVPWEKLPEAIRVYALADVKHGWMVWCVIFGCILRNLFPDPDSALYLTNVPQSEFVEGLSTLVLEALVGTEPHPDRLKTAQTREDLVDSISYRTSAGDLSKRPPSRVKVLQCILSPWAHISHGGSRYLRIVRADTLRKFREIRSLFEEFGDEIGESILNVEFTKDQEEYILLGMSEDMCLYTSSRSREAAPLRGWACQPNHPVPVASLRTSALVPEWLKWSTLNRRSVKPALLEWILMDPYRGERFVENLSACGEFGKKFGGLYMTVAAALERLGRPVVGTPEFLKEKVEKVRYNLAEEERLLKLMQAEVDARKARIDVYQSVLDSAENELWDEVVGYQSRLPCLPPRPTTRRARRKTNPQSSSTTALQREGAKKRKRSSSRAPVSGVKRPAARRTEAEDRSYERSRSTGPSDRSRRPQKSWPPRTSSSSRRRSVSRAPSVTAVYRNADEHSSLGRVSRGSAKRGRMSDLLYDSIQERNIALERQVEETRVIRRVQSPDRAQETRDRDSQSSDHYVLDLNLNDCGDLGALDSDSE